VQKSEPEETSEPQQVEVEVQNLPSSSTQNDHESKHQPSEERSEQNDEIEDPFKDLPLEMKEKLKKIVDKEVNKRLGTNNGGANEDEKRSEETKRPNELKTEEFKRNQLLEPIVGPNKTINFLFAMTTPGAGKTTLKETLSKSKILII